VPELPDVEGFRRTLAQAGQGRRVTGVEVADPGVLRGVTPRGLRHALRGRRIEAAERHGKWLVARTEGPALLLHFGMTGRLVSCRDTEPRHRHDRVIIATDDGGQLRFRDQRKLQGIRLAPDEAALQRVLADQGPDALTIDGEAFEALLAHRRARVKSVLLDQSALAGLGNLLGDEILWRARVHPARRAAELDPRERRRIAAATRRVLRACVPAGQVPARRSWLTGRRDDPAPACPRCGGPLRRERIAGRTTVWCPGCQPLAP
jgi:formamidopyrimidine-DNA glycosylase